MTVQPTGRVLPSILGQQNEERTAKAASILAGYQAEAKHIADNLRINVDLTPKLRKSPNMRLSARVGSHVIYRSRKAHRWGRK